MERSKNKARFQHNISLSAMQEARLDSFQKKHPQFSLADMVMAMIEAMEPTPETPTENIEETPSAPTAQEPALTATVVLQEED